MSEQCEEVQAQIDKLRPYQNESVFCAARINRLEKELRQLDGLAKA